MNWLRIRKVERAMGKLRAKQATPSFFADPATRQHEAFRITDQQGGSGDAAKFLDRES